MIFVDVVKDQIHHQVIVWSDFVQVGGRVSEWERQVKGWGKRKGQLRNKEARKTNEKRKELQLIRMNEIT